MKHARTVILTKIWWAEGLEKKFLELRGGSVPPSHRTQLAGAGHSSRWLGSGSLKSQITPTKLRLGMTMDGRHLCPEQYTFLLTAPVRFQILPLVPIPPAMLFQGSIIIIGLPWSQYTIPCCCLAGRTTYHDHVVHQRNIYSSKANPRMLALFNRMQHPLLNSINEWCSTTSTAERSRTYRARRGSKHPAFNATTGPLFSALAPPAHTISSPLPGRRKSTGMSRRCGSKTLQLTMSHAQSLQMVSLTHLVPPLAPSFFPWGRAKIVSQDGSEHTLEERRICLDQRELAGGKRAVLMGPLCPQFACRKRK
jgi:hypothetical protein